MPSRGRLQHGGFSEPIRESDPETGVPVVHRRAVDTLGQMLANGTITQEMHDAGARTVAQDEASSVVYGMPKEAVKLGAAERSLPLGQISGEIVRFA